MAHPHRYLIPVALLLAGGLVVDSASRALASPESDETQARQPSTTPAQMAKKVDRLMASYWKQNGVKPRKAATDAEFLRRASLDLTGKIPDEETSRRFLSGKSNKRAALIQDLLKSDAYARTLGLRWTYLLVGREYLYRSKIVKQVKKAMRQRRRMMGGGEMDEGMMADNDQALTLNEWLEKQLKENVSWGKVAGELISAEGRADKNPATHYMLRHLRQGKAEDVTGSVMKVFQGLQLQCAQCHDDKMEAKFTQRLFYGVAAFFTRTKSRRLPPDGMTMREYRMARRNNKTKKPIRPGPFAIFDRPSGQIRIPAAPGEEGRLVLPEFFVTNRVVNPGPAVKRRSELAKMITAKSNPYFAKATVNRMWSFFFGRGIIQPVDAINQDDYVHPEVLKLLTEDFKANDYDLRRLTEIMVSTRAYGLSSAGSEEHKEDELAMFARAPLRNLSAEQLFYSVLEATGMEDLKRTDRRTRRRLQRMKFQTLRQFLRTFSEDEDTEELDEGTIPQALLRLNGTLTNDAVRARPGHPVYDRLFRMRSLQKRIDTIYLRVLSRFPTKDESRKLKKFLKTRKRAVEQAQAYSDIFWALLNSSEFNFNH